MSDDDSASDDFQRWFFGGAPPECDGWDRHAFEDALQGVPAASTARGTAAREPAIAEQEEVLSVA